MLRRCYRTVLGFFERFYWLFFALAVLTLAFYCFRCLDVQYVDSWDEARHGVNAYEMIQNGNYIQHTYNYVTDDWNLKPSLSYWAIVLGYRIFGYNVLGLRFFSALAYLLTGVVTALFAKRSSREASILVLGFFCANERPLSAHLARAGDADALFMLFFTLAMLVMLQIREKHSRLALCGLFFSLAFLTKSWHAGMIAVVCGLYLLGTRELFRIRLKEWLQFLAATLLPLILWFGWRAMADGGLWFLKQMIEVDLLARTGTANFEGHSYSFSFYYDTVFGAEGFIYRWLLLITLVLAAAGLVWLWRRNSRPDKTGHSCQDKTEHSCPDKAAAAEGYGIALWFLIPFLGFSAVSTKLIWYCYPCTVPLFLASALLMGWVLRLPMTEGWKPGSAAEQDRETSASAFAADAAAGADECGNRVVYGAAAGTDKEPTREKLTEGSDWKRELQAVLCALAALGCIALVAVYMRTTYLDVIRGAKGNAFQLFIQESISRDSEEAGRTAYIWVTGEDPEDMGDWDQNVLLLAELSGDFHCTDGGMEAFLESSDSVLYTERLYYEENQETLEAAGAEILYENAGYLLLRLEGLQAE